MHYQIDAVQASSLIIWLFHGKIFFYFREFFQFPVILNIAMVAFEVRELVFVKMTAPSR